MKSIARENNITSQKCAFCKNWYDPTNAAIKPRGTITWDIEPDETIMTERGKGN